TRVNNCDFIRARSCSHFWGNAWRHRVSRKILHLTSRAISTLVDAWKSETGGAMKLEIVWRNPNPTAKRESSFERVTHEERIAVYLVSTAKTEALFTVILAGAA